MNKKERRQITRRIGDLLDQNCESCQHRYSNKEVFNCNTQCHVGKELLSLGKRLDEGGNNVPVETKEKKPKLTLAIYQDLQAKGLKDKEIAKQFNFTPTYVSQLKKKWGIRPPLEKPKETPIKSDRIGEIEQIVAEKNHLISVQKAKIEELESKHDKLQTFIHQELETYSKLNADLQSENARYYDRIVYLDQQHENDKKALETARKTLELYTKENNHLRGLVRIWL